jgi:uncharacterized protein
VQFEWDPDKAALNLKDHGVTFVFATAAFEDAFALEWIDDRFDYHEERTRLVGQAAGILLSVIYTERREVYRIISARRATKNEQDEYYSQNSA